MVVAGRRKKSIIAKQKKPHQQQDETNHIKGKDRLTRTKSTTWRRRSALIWQEKKR